jgi:hypothetical protein
MVDDNLAKALFEYGHLLDTTEPEDPTDDRRPAAGAPAMLGDAGVPTDSSMAPLPDSDAGAPPFDLVKDELLQRAQAKQASSLDFQKRHRSE